MLSLESDVAYIDPSLVLALYILLGHLYGISILYTRTAIILH